MNLDDFRVHRVCSVHEPAFAQLLRIYTDALPESERKSTERLSAMMSDPQYFFLVATMANDVAGFSIVRVFAHADAALLEYMAVASELRNRGVGRWLFAQTAEFDGICPRFLLAEVDSDKLPSDDEEDRSRRKAFYRRMGCREVDQLCYVMPPVSTAPPPEMDILVYKQPLPPFLDRSHLRQWLERCYVEVYGLYEDDFRIEIMMRGLPAHVPLI